MEVLLTLHPAGSDQFTGRGESRGKRTLMNLRRLRYFVAVAEERHFRRAAERLFIAQPSLSQQIRVLEKDLGVELFVRSTRRVELTPAGVRFHERATEILRLFDDAVEEASRIDAGEEGRIHLGFIGSSTYELMPAISRTLQTELPRLSVELEGEMLAPTIWDALAEGRLDIGVTRPHPPIPGISSMVLRSEDLVLAVGVDHRLSRETTARLEELADEPFVSYPRERSSMTTLVRTACLAAGFDPRVRAEVAETSTMVSFVAAGLGVALVPESVVHVRIPGVQYVALADPPVIDLVAAWRDGAPERVVDQVIQRLKVLVTRS